MNRGAWWAIVHGVAESQIQLSTRMCARTHTHTHTHTRADQIYVLQKSPLSIMKEGLNIESL